MDDAREIADRCRNEWPEYEGDPSMHAALHSEAADMIDSLAARVAELEAEVRHTRGVILDHVIQETEQRIDEAVAAAKRAAAAAAKGEGE